MCHAVVTEAHMTWRGVYIFNWLFHAFTVYFWVVHSFNIYSHFFAPFPYVVSILTYLLVD